MGHRQECVEAMEEEVLCVGAGNSSTLINQPSEPSVLTRWQFLMDVTT